MSPIENSGKTRSTLPEGFLDVFGVAQLPSTHSGAVIEGGGKAIYNTKTQGFLCFGQYRKGYPTIPLKAFFSIQIDDNSSDDRNILILDVYDHYIDRVIGKRLITRKDFPNAREFSLFEFAFTPPSAEANMEFRIYYMGSAYVLADKIAIVDPAKRPIQSVDDIPAPPKPDGPIQPTTTPPPITTTPPPTTTTPPSEYCRGNELICLPEMTPQLVKSNGGKVHRGEFRNQRYLPSSGGGLEFTVQLDTSRKFCVDFELEGNIANRLKGELSGGKVSLFTIKDLQSHYYISLQRMYHDYRGGDCFRLFMGDREDVVKDGAAWLITTRKLAGEYTMKNWGDEPHHFRFTIDGNRCQLKIDNFSSKTKDAPYAIPGRQGQLQMVLGNREASMLNRGQGAITWFRKLKVFYE